jgi:hypothetical protein
MRPHLSGTRIPLATKEEATRFISGHATTGVFGATRWIVPALALLLLVPLAGIRRLPVRLLDERDCVQPDRHDAAQPMGKLLMIAESAASLLLAIMVAARAVNILH